MTLTTGELEQRRRDERVVALREETARLAKDLEAKDATIARQKDQLSSLVDQVCGIRCFATGSGIVGKVSPLRKMVATNRNCPCLFVEKAGPRLYFAR